jgi:glycogen synthase
MNPNYDLSGELVAVPRRVLMTADTLSSVWTYSLEIARTLCEQDVEIALATMGAPLTEAQWREAADIPNLGIFESNYKLEWMHNPWDDVRAAGEWLLVLERKVQPDVIHLNSCAHGALPWRAPRLVIAHSDVLSWWRAVKGEEAPLHWEEYRRNVSEGLQGADVVVALSRTMLLEMKDRFGPFQRSEIIPHGREVSFRHVPKQDFIFSSGRVWDEAKNIRTLAAAARDLPWPVCVAGEKHDPEGRTISFENVQLLGKLSRWQMAERLERAPIFCLPARYEPFGLSVLEAALAGCALVLGDIPSLREIWRDTALFVPPNDADALRRTLQRLIAEPDMRRDHAERAHEHALDFTALRMTSSYLALYSELMAPVEHSVNAFAHRT